MIYLRGVSDMQNQLVIKGALWHSLISHLRHQGQGVRESGAFLLGSINGGQRNIQGFLPYERLQADALHEDYVALSSKSFAKLWVQCRAKKMSVVGDVHTHRFGPQQSISDKANPMIARQGHMAIIIPRFAQRAVRPVDLGIHNYCGSHRWSSVFGDDVNQQFNVEV